MSKHSCCSFFSYILLVCIVYEGSHFNNGKKRISHRRICSAFFLWSLGPNAVRIHCISYACRFFRGHLYFARSLTQLCVLFTRVAILITEKNAFVIEEFLGDFFWWSLGPNRVRSQCIRSICSFVPMSN